jgi:hypothetical protein
VTETLVWGRYGILGGAFFSLLAYWDQRNEFRATAALDNALRRIPLRVELRMLERSGVRGIRDGMLKERVVHFRPRLREIADLHGGALLAAQLRAQVFCEIFLPPSR